MLLGGAAGKAGELIGGEKVGAITKGVVGGGIATLQGARSATALAQRLPLGQFVAKQVLKKAPTMAKTLGIAAMADSPASPIGDIIGLAMAGYMGYGTIKDAIKMWNEANQYKQ